MNKKYPKVGFGILIMDGDKILLGKRHDDPKKASSELHGEGTWTMPGGKLNFHERPEDGAAREVLEETSIVVAPKSLKLVSMGNEMVEDAHFVTFGFLAEEFKGEPKIMEPDEITEWKWFKEEDLPQNIYKPSLKLLNNYKSGKMYN